MSQPIQLLPMYCLKCQTPIPAGVDETVWVCSACGQGLLLDPEKGLQALEIHVAAGIPQALPGNKMSSHGKHWASNPETQIKWGLSYIKSRYGSPNKAWSSWQHKGWY